MARISRHFGTCLFPGAAFALLSALLLAIGLSSVAFSASAAGLRSVSSRQAGFHAFIGALWPLAEKRGVSRATFDAAFAGVSFDPQAAAMAQSQPEFTRPIWDYVRSAVSADRVERGRQRASSE